MREGDRIEGMRVGKRGIGGQNPCFIVAEAGLAHEGSEKLAFSLVDAAVRGRADAVKFQVYRAKELVDYERDRELYDRFKRKELKYEVFGKLKEYAESKGLIWFATAHTMSAFDYLRSLGMELWKVGSGERYGDLFGAVMDTGKPVIVSTGMRWQHEIFDLIDRYGGKNVCFLHCVTQYPTIPHYLNMNFLDRLGVVCRQKNSVMGYSCHLEGSLGVEIAVSKGAKVVEKHLKLEESTGQDTHGALFAEDFRKMETRVREIEHLLGSDIRVYSSEERENEKWALKGKDGKRPL